MRGTRAGRSSPTWPLASATHTTLLRSISSPRGEYPHTGVWLFHFAAAELRLNPGPNPPETALAEYYEVPWNNPAAPVWGYSPRGLDIDRNNVVWVALASGHLASFDRRKCQRTAQRPEGHGQHCPEGWTLYQTPGPKFADATEAGSTDSHYYDWVDQFDTLGLGKTLPSSRATIPIR